MQLAQAEARRRAITESLRWVRSQSRWCPDQLRLVTWSSTRRRTRRRAAVWCNNRTMEQHKEEKEEQSSSNSESEQQKETGRGRENRRKRHSEPWAYKQHKGAGRIIINVNVDFRWGNKTKPKLLIGKNHRKKENQIRKQREKHKKLSKKQTKKRNKSSSLNRPGTTITTRTARR